MKQWIEPTPDTINAVIREEPRSLLEFYLKVQPVLKHYFEHKVNDRDDAEELVADTLLSVIDSLPQFKQQSHLLTWIIGIAKHELVDYYRRKKIKTILFSRFPFLESLVDKALGPQLALEEKEAKHRIFKTLKHLSEGYELILRLRYIEGWSVAAIARELNITYKAAESRLARARLAFQELYVWQSTASSASG